jgi:undecaprenyl-diphosphatase
MNITEAVVLGIIQGLTEWLPVSSSGHLVLAEVWMGLEMPVAYNVMLHLATALVILIMFRKDAVAIIKGVLKPAGARKVPYWQKVRKDLNALFGWWIILGSMPIAVLGILFNEQFKIFFTSAFIVGVALVGTGIVLTVSAVSQKSAHKKRLTALDAYTVGFGQALALVPGFSRSGFTISFGLMRGLERETAAKFSILLAVPAIIGAALYEMPELFESGSTDISMAALLVGSVTAFIVGFIAINLLLFIVRKAGFHYFAVYCFALAAIILTTT